VERPAPRRKKKKAERPQATGPVLKDAREEPPQGGVQEQQDE